MITTSPTRPEAKLEDISAQVKQRISQKDANQFNTLINSFFKHISPEDLASYKTEDLSGMMITLYREMQTPPNRKAMIFNPNIEEHGWQSPHSVILIHHADIRYIIDSVSNTLNAHRIRIHTIFHAYLSIERDNKGKITSISEPKQGASELLLYLEIDHHSQSHELKELSQAINQTITDVGLVANDYKPMLQKLDSIAENLAQTMSSIDAQTIEESGRFLRWLKEDHFTFLAYDEYEIDPEGIKPTPDTGLGLFRHYAQPKAQRFDAMTRAQLEYAGANQPIVFAKSGHLSSVHRAAYSDYVVIKRFNDQGEIIGGYRLMGLYKHNVYINSASDIPIIRKKIQTVLEHSGIIPGTYNYAELSHILGTFPRDELFLASTEQLLTTTLDILYIRERRKVKLFLREDIDEKFVSAIFYAPRDQLNSQLQEQVHRLLTSEMEIESSTTSTWFSESYLARCRFVFKLKSPLQQPLDQAKLEASVALLARDWDEDLQSALNEALGEERGIAFYRKYINAFPASYIEENNPRVAVADIERMESLCTRGDNNLAVSFYRSTTIDESEIKIKIFHKGTQLSLSDMIPVLENFGLRVIEELPYEIEHQQGIFWIYNFTVDFPSSPDIDPNDYRQALSDAFIAVWSQQADNDNFNQLILEAGLTWRQVATLRAYSRYMKQISIGFSQKYIAQSLINHTEIAKKLIVLFDCRFNPEKNRSEKTAKRITEQLEGLFEHVASLSEDRILRYYLTLLQATLRTNFFQQGHNGSAYKPYLSIKLDPHLIPDIPLPRPQFEIFVYSPRVEGVHLRGGKVARGGLRWSDRTEDFRTEILGLVKAQQVKNAVIVPVGAKGGFIAKRLPPPNDRDQFWREGIACYQLFIRGLLDLTDNIKDGEVIPPPKVVRYDEDDTYLVVAADKGTATFSDIANDISQEYGHWLGDAFASGGSNGYDHKKMGITARGAWVSVQRHFREMGINIQQQPFSVIGIGDMSGDVFGNGMLLSEQIKLVAAFNHLHIFIDPSPDTAASFAERQRLFELPRSSWKDYNPELISQGGGIFERSAKSIKLTPEIQQLVNTQKQQMAPAELISLLLKANIDLLWNGGIGTYVKASHEHHSEVGDKTNDGLRINANELQCKVVGEGGNLGLTQQARIEYGLLGGSIFTDFVDNAAGVDCSDHEVNIKILLDRQVADGELTEKQRNRQLETMTESVAELVLENNYRQTQAIALASMEANRRTEEYRRVIQYLESTGKLNRALEFLPEDDVLSERKAQQLSLTQAELSILISYVKADMKEALMNVDLGDDPNLAAPVESAFPPALVKKFRPAVANHPLRREIIATQIANDMFNHMGISYFDRLRQSTGASHEDIAKAYVAAKAIFSLDDIWQAVEALDYTLTSDAQYHMMLRASRLVRRASRWLIKNHRTQLQVSTLIERYAEPIDNLGQKLPSLLPEPLREQWQMASDELIHMGAPKSLANTLASCEYLYDFLGIIAASLALDKQITIVASGFFALAERLDLDDFSEHLETHMPTTTLWQAMARESLRDDLEWQQRQLTQNMLSATACSEANLSEALEQWLAEQSVLTQRWKQMITELNNQNDGDIAMLSIAIRELSDLSQATAVV